MNVRREPPSVWRTEPEEPEEKVRSLGVMQFGEKALVSELRTKLLRTKIRGGKE